MEAEDSNPVIFCTFTPCLQRLRLINQVMNETTNIDLSVLIVNYKTSDYLGACINSVLNQKTDYKLEVIVVDNNSGDQHLMPLLKQYDERVKYIVNDYNWGFSVGMNQAYAISSGTYVIAFNPDAELKTGAASVIINYMNQHQSVGMLGGITEDSDGALHPPYVSIEKSPASRVFNRATDQKASQHLLERPTTVNWIFGTGIVIRRSSLGQSKCIYPEKTFLFWEEYYLCKNITEAGYDLVVHSDFKMIHHTSVSFKFNPKKLKNAAKLSLSWEYVVRKELYTKSVAKRRFFTMLIDGLALYFIIFLRRFFSSDKQKNWQRKIELARYSAYIDVALNILASGQSYAVRQNELSYARFNDGQPKPNQSPTNCQ